MGIFGCATVGEFAARANKHIHVQFSTINEFLHLMRRGCLDITRVEFTISSPSSAHHHLLRSSSLQLTSSAIDSELKAVREVDLTILRLRSLVINLEASDPESLITAWACAQIILLTLRRRIWVVLRNPLPREVFKNMEADKTRMIMNRLKRMLTKLDTHCAGLSADLVGVKQTVVFVTKRRAMPQCREQEPFAERDVRRIRELLPESHEFDAVCVRQDEL